MTNFEFLKKIDCDLYEIAFDAEKLYRDEYFEQCMAQTRRFAENVCKEVLGSKAKADYTFDDMLNKLKDSSSSNPREKEFIDDLYFLKKAGNTSVHSSKVKKDGITALECLQRAFEIAINYAVLKKGPEKKILKLRYDEELLVLGEKSSKVTLREKYIREKNKNSLKIEKCKRQKTPSQTVRKKTFSAKHKELPIFTFIVIAIIVLIIVRILL